MKTSATPLVQRQAKVSLGTESKVFSSQRVSAIIQNCGMMTKLLKQAQTKLNSLLNLLEDISV